MYKYFTAVVLQFENSRLSTLFIQQAKLHDFVFTKTDNKIVNWFRIPNKILDCNRLKRNFSFLVSFYAIIFSDVLVSTIEKTARKLQLWRFYQRIGFYSRILEDIYRYRTFITSFDRLRLFERTVFTVTETFETYERRKWNNIDMLFVNGFIGLSSRYKTCQHRPKNSTRFQLL